MVELHRWGASLALVLALAVGTVGCSDTDDAERPSAAPTAELTPDESVLPAVQQVPEAPAAMAVADAAGAEAFVRHYFALVNYAQATGDLEPLRAVSGAGCAACQGGLEWVEKAFRKGRVIEGGIHSVDHIAVEDVGANTSTFTAKFVLRTNDQQVLGGGGRVVEDYQGGKARLRLEAEFVDAGRWIVRSWETL